MQDFILHFVRDVDGRWTCVTPATLDTPAGRIQVAPGTVFTPGIKFMNWDLAAMLDEQQANRKGRV